MIKQTTLAEIAKHDFNLAIYVAQLSILLHTTKPKKKKSLEERILKKFQTAHFHNTPENYKDIFAFLIALCENENIADMNGLGGSKPKDVKELIAQFELNTVEESNELLLCRLWNRL